MVGGLRGGGGGRGGALGGGGGGGDGPPGQRVGLKVALWCDVCEKLWGGSAGFLPNFRKVYIGEQVRRLAGAPWLLDPGGFEALWG